MLHDPDYGRDGIAFSWVLADETLTLTVTDGRIADAFAGANSRSPLIAQWERGDDGGP